MAHGVQDKTLSDFLKHTSSPAKDFGQPGKQKTLICTKQSSKLAKAKADSAKQSYKHSDGGAALGQRQRPCGARIAQLHRPWWPAMQ